MFLDVRFSQNVSQNMHKLSSIHAIKASSDPTIIFDHTSTMTDNTIMAGRILWHSIQSCWGKWAYANTVNQDLFSLPLHTGNEAMLRERSELPRWKDICTPLNSNSIICMVKCLTGCVRQGLSWYIRQAVLSCWQIGPRETVAAPRNNTNEPRTMARRGIHAGGICGRVGSSETIPFRKPKNSLDDNKYLQQHEQHVLKPRALA